MTLFAAFPPFSLNLITLELVFEKESTFFSWIEIKSSKPHALGEG
jgi:hypothetical protein